jgi:hypothetical protein
MTAKGKLLPFDGLAKMAGLGRGGGNTDLNGFFFLKCRPAPISLNIIEFLHRLGNQPTF